MLGEGKGKYNSYEEFCLTGRFFLLLFLALLPVSWRRLEYLLCLDQPPVVVLDWRFQKAFSGWCPRERSTEPVWLYRQSGDEGPTQTLEFLHSRFFIQSISKLPCRTQLPGTTRGKGSISLSLSPLPGEG